MHTSIATIGSRPVNGTWQRPRAGDAPLTAVTSPTSHSAAAATDMAATHAARSGAAQLRGRVEVYDMSSGVEVRVPDEQVLGHADPIIAGAGRTGLAVDSFLRGTLKRDGYDDAGSPLRIVVHSSDLDGTSPVWNNGQWDPATSRIYLGDGDGALMGPLVNALDVVVHETTHGIIRSKYEIKYEGQRGAVDESFADVMGALADPDDWLIGEDAVTPDVPGDAVRDLANPRFANLAELPSIDSSNVHDLSGVPSLAAVRVAERLGREEMGRIWYTALVEHLDQRAGYAGAARATLDAATQLHGASSDAVAAVRDAWSSVGVDPRWSPARSERAAERRRTG